MTNETFYQRLEEKLAELPDDPAFDTEAVWTRIQAPVPQRRALGVWLWPTSLAASVLLAGGIWFFTGKPAVETIKMVAVVKAKQVRPEARPDFPNKLEASISGKPLLRSVSSPTGLASRKQVKQSREWLVRTPTTAAEQLTQTPATASESVPVLIAPELSIPSQASEVATTETVPQPEVAETPGTIVLTIPVPGEEAELTRRPFVTRLFKQWKRYNRGEAVDWEDLSLKPLKLTKAHADTTRLAPRTTN